MITQEWNSIDQGHYPHKWEHTFASSQSQAERLEWLNEVIEQSRLNGVGLVIKETADGYVFGFEDCESWTAFVVNNFGNPESVGGHVHTESFPGAATPNEYFLKAADAYLESMGIEFTRTTNGDEVNYQFNNFLDRATFQWLTESSELDRMADQIYETEQFYERYEAVKQRVDAAFEINP